MQTITVTIGRNVGQDPLPQDRWNEFIADTRAAVESAVSDIWVATPYRGSWDGVPEDAFVFYGPVVGTLANTPQERALKQRLSVLAGYYGQQAIGVSVGFSELVEAIDVLAPVGEREGVRA